MPKFNPNRDVVDNRATIKVNNVIPDEIIADEINHSRTYIAYKNAGIYKVIVIKDVTSDGFVVYDWTDTVGFYNLYEAVVYMHDRIRRNPEKKFDILPL